MEFIYNDGGRSKYFKGLVSDCVVRATSIVTERDYKEVYNELKTFINNSRFPAWKHKPKSPRNGTPKQITKDYLKFLGFEWTPTMHIGSGCQIHLASDELPKGKVIVSVTGHITAVIDGTLYDTFDCSRDGKRCVYGYWTKK